MTNLDLSKAIEAGAIGVWNHRPMQRTTDGRPLPFEDAKHYEQRRHREMGQAAITAALPHILEALADELDAEADSEYRGHGEWSPEHQAAKILRAKAEEARA